jgi:hypothetical protein
MTAPRLPYLPKLRALLGLAAAYAIALQLVLAALVAAEHAAVAASGKAASFTICASSAGEPAGDAAPSTGALACCVLCTIALSTPPDGPQVAEAGAAYGAPAQRHDAAFHLPSFHHQGPRSSQGPPASA